MVGRKPALVLESSIELDSTDKAKEESTVFEEESLENSAVPVVATQFY